MGRNTGRHRLPPLALQFEHSDLQLSLDAMATGVIILGPDLNIALVNKAFFQIWNLTPDQAPIGVPFRTLIETCHHNDIVNTHDVEWRDHVASRLGEIRKGDVAPREILRRDGGAIVYSVTSLPGGKRLLSYRDISEARRCETALEEARRSATLAEHVKSSFLANVSHEIRTPMSGVLGMAELLGQSKLDSRQKTFVEIIVKSGNALLKTINDILDLSMIDTGQITLEPVPFSLADAIADVVALVAAPAREKNLELIVRIQPDLDGSYIGDVERIQQIVSNLLDNALKFTDSGHVLVDVSGKQEGADTAIQIAIIDTGIGVPQDRLVAIFDKFCKLSSPRAHYHQGTGLGLAISAGLVKLMSGRIDAESREGEGSSFRFTICLPRAAKLENAPATPMEMAGARILVVDDNAVTRAVLMEQMTGWGFDPCAAKDAEEGLVILKAIAALGLRLDCLVLDCHMPGMSGAEMARIVRATPQIAQAPIIMLTSVDRPLGPPGYRDLAIDQHLVKPARASALRQALISVIGKNRNESAFENAEPRLESRPTRKFERRRGHDGANRQSTG